MNQATQAELQELLEGLCEERLSPAEIARLESIVLGNQEATRLYLHAMHLHGCLSWDTAKGQIVADSERLADSVNPTLASPIETTASEWRTPPSRRSIRRWRPLLGSIFTGVAVLLLAIGVGRWAKSPASLEEGIPNSSITVTPPSVSQSGYFPAIAETPDPALPADSVLNPADRPKSDAPNRPSSSSAVAGNNVPSANPTSKGLTPGKVTPEILPEGSVVAFIDAQIRASWESAEIHSSVRADDTEWLRRVHLDMTGRIPAPERVDAFLKDSRPNKREAIVDDLLDDPLYVRNWTAVWTNLLIGRSANHQAERTGLKRFLRERIARNRPWNETVYELVAAEGSPEENGAAGYLLAHLNNEAVPATAITARLFLGTQVQCTQCHNHPFNDSKQSEFWELNSFFQQAARVDQPQKDPRSGTMTQKASLVNRETGGPIYYESRDGLLRAAFPKFEGHQIDTTPEVNRRKELGSLLVQDEKRQLARALVNRMWGHFFGAAFTRPVDDMGPHNPPTHPAVLERLTQEFVRSGYDVKQLTRWICLSEAYNLSSRYSDSNTIDDPSVGNPPLFSRVYVKSMTAEQLYDSLLVATRAEDSTVANRMDFERQRDQWIQQFIVDLETDENDEASTFDGTVPQALMMMNSELVQAAVSEERGTRLHQVVQDRGNEVQKIRQLTLAALSRYPTTAELNSLRKVLRERIARAPRDHNREKLLAEGLQDIFWALLNSNEFVLVH